MLNYRRVEREQCADPNAVEAVVAKIRSVYAGWGRTTAIEIMRSEWNAFCTDGQPEGSSEPAWFDGVDAAWIGASSRDRKTAIIYVHGGGFKIGSIRSHHQLMQHISQASGSPVLGIDYALSPEHLFPRARDQVADVYRQLLRSGFSPNHIALVGDSAGGGLVLSALVDLRDSGVAMPAATALLSPLVDLSAAGRSYDDPAVNDPIHQRAIVKSMAKQYLGETPATDPRASPLFADLREMPPTLIQVGGREVLLDECERLAEELAAHGTSSTLEIWPGMIHVFQQFPGQLPEAADAIQTIGTFIADRFSQSGSAQP